MAEYIVQSEELSAVADAIREKRSTTGELIFPDGMVEAIGQIDTQLPTQEKTIDPSTTQVVVEPDDGKTLSKVTVSAIQTETATASPSTSQQVLTPTSGKFFSQVTVNAMPSGALGAPTISSSGLITSKIDTSGYIASGTQKTMQLTTQSGQTVTPSTSTQTAVSSGRYTTGTVYVQGDSNLTSSNIKSGVSIFGVSGSYTGGYPYGYEKQSLDFVAATDTGYIVTTNIYPRAFVLIGDTVIRSDSNWDKYTIMVTALRDETFAADVFTDYKSTTTAYRVYGSKYVTDQTLANNYNIRWTLNSVRIQLNNTDYPLDGSFIIIIFGEDRS